MKNKIFTHGTIFNFYKSAREMAISEFENLVSGLNRPLLFGKINLSKEHLFVYGYLENLSFVDDINFKYKLIDTNNRDLEGLLKNISFDFENLVITHEACFDILIEEEKIQYQVIYITINCQKINEEITYFIAQDKVLDNPLDYVVDFWEKVYLVGKNVDFSMTGCRINN